MYGEEDVVVIHFSTIFQHSPLSYWRKSWKICQDCWCYDRDPNQV